MADEIKKEETTLQAVAEETPSQTEEQSRNQELGESDETIDEQPPSQEEQKLEEESQHSQSVEAETSRDQERETPASPQKRDRFAMAQSRVVAARAKVEDAEEEIEECIRNIQEDLAKMEAYEAEVLEPVVEESRKILAQLGMEEPKIEPKLAEVELEDPAEKKLRIEDLSSGKGAAFFWGLIAAVATVGGWYAYAVQKVGAPLIPQKLPDLATLSTLAGKISLLAGPAEHPPVGAAIVVGSALAVWWLVYMVLVAMRAAKNQRIAEAIEEEAGFYCKKKEECKALMEQVREQLATLHETVRKYEVLLHEKNASLRRALYLEEAQSFEQLHDRSKETAREIDEMLHELDRLLATPIAQSGMLTKESTEALRQAKRLVNDQILRLYS